MFEKIKNHLNTEVETDTLLVTTNLDRYIIYGFFIAVVLEFLAVIAIVVNAFVQFVQ